MLLLFAQNRLERESKQNTLLLSLILFLVLEFLKQWSTHFFCKVGNLRVVFVFHWKLLRKKKNLFWNRAFCDKANFGLKRTPVTFFTWDEKRTLWETEKKKCIFEIKIWKTYFGELNSSRKEKKKNKMIFLKIYLFNSAKTKSTW